MAMEDAVEVAATDYVTRLEKLLTLQYALIECTAEVEEDKVDLDPAVWELVGRLIHQRHGESAYDALPLVMMAMDVYLYSIGKLDDENYFDIVERMDIYIQNMKQTIKLMLEAEKARSGGWLN